jgi:hypothetical protein
MPQYFNPFTIYDPNRGYAQYGYGDPYGQMSYNDQSFSQQSAYYGYMPPQYNPYYQMPYMGVPNYYNMQYTASGGNLNI